MINENIFFNMVEQYDHLAYTHEYIFGFRDRGTVYAVFTDSKVLPFICSLDKASRNQGYALRFCPTKVQKELLKRYDLIPLCSTEFFNDRVKNGKYNRGEVFEEMISRYFHIEWKKDTLPFTKGGDLEIGGIPYQVKFEKATFTNEKTLWRFMNA